MPGIRFYRRKNALIELLEFIDLATDAISHAKTLREVIDILISQNRISQLHRQKFYDSLAYMKRRGYVALRPFLKPTIEGRRLLTAAALLEVKLPRPKHWDHRWRIIVFDIPTEKNNHRLAFQDRIKTLGFKMIQKSVWAYPYECGKEIDELRTFYGVRNYVTYVIATEIEDDGELRRRFDL